MTARRTILGFTLVEVIVAVVILSLCLIAIFSSEGISMRTGVRARNITMSTMLARCKMAEVEEQMMRQGFAINGERGDDACCEGGEQPGFICSWAVDPVMLPDAAALPEDVIAQAESLASGSQEGPSANPGDLQNSLAGSAGGDALGSFAVQAAYPILRPLIEAQVRRATVTVRWQEGTEEVSGRGLCEESE